MFLCTSDLITHLEDKDTVLSHACVKVDGPVIRLLQLSDLHVARVDGALDSTSSTYTREVANILNSWKRDIPLPTGENPDIHGLLISGDFIDAGACAKLCRSTTPAGSPETNPHSTFESWHRYSSTCVDGIVSILGCGTDTLGRILAIPGSKQFGTPRAIRR